MLHSPVVPGTVLAGRYELVGSIARGGMGEVFEATDRSLGRRVALKLYRPGAVEDRQRFEAEVHVLAGLNHPGLVHLYDAGHHDDGEFLVLELIDGPALSTVIAEHGPLADATARSMGEALADALAYVHDAGVVHRDVTPANILCPSDGRPRLADFGIARLLDSSRVTAKSTTVGTAAYMAPEQVEGGDVTPAADVYALALVLHEALSGRLAFDGVGHEAALARLARDPDVTTAVPSHWRGLLQRMTARQPSDRPNAAEVRDRITELASADEVGASPMVVAPAAGLPSSPGDSLAHTTVMQSPDGGTEVMPAAHRPAAEWGAGVTSGASIGWTAPAWLTSVRRRQAVMLVAAAALVAALAVAAARDSSFDERRPPPQTIAEDTDATEPPPTTVAPPPTTSPPEPDEEHRGEGKGKGKRHDDD